MPAPLGPLRSSVQLQAQRGDLLQRAVVKVEWEPSQLPPCPRRGYRDLGEKLRDELEGRAILTLVHVRGDAPRIARTTLDRLRGVPDGAGREPREQLGETLAGRFDVLVRSRHGYGTYRRALTPS